MGVHIHRGMGYGWPIAESPVDERALSNVLTPGEDDQDKPTTSDLATWVGANLDRLSTEWPRCRLLGSWLLKPDVFLGSMISGTIDEPLGVHLLHLPEWVRRNDSVDWVFERTRSDCFYPENPSPWFREIPLELVGPDYELGRRVKYLQQPPIQPEIIALIYWLADRGCLPDPASAVRSLRGYVATWWY